jgi:methylmalonyl-CoA/ethylmalonyl-CoA epimerase
MIKRFDHVGVIVDDLDEAARLLVALGLEPGETIDREDLRVAFFACGNAKVEIIEPLDSDLRAQRLGEGNRARIEHIAFEVGDLGAALTALGVLGVEPNAPPLRLPDRSMFWTQPETSDGIMFQFVERA